MRKLALASCLIAALLPAGMAEAQGILPVAVEARGGLALPQGEWSDDAQADTGFGYGLNARLQVFPLISIYGGWESYSFDTEAENVEAKDAGFRAGAQLSLPLSMLIGLSPHAFAGLIYNETSFEAEGSDVEFEADSALGYEIGAGISFPLAPAFSLTPGVRYRTHSADLPAGEGTEEIDVSYLVLDVGLKLGI